MKIKNAWLAPPILLVAMGGLSLAQTSSTGNDDNWSGESNMSDQSTFGTNWSKDMGSGFSPMTRCRPCAPTKS
ncbi:MAG: hypothetical protein ORN49_14115 [Rhodobacteraceae bacterium]|nr:hypothetical protein [Paracoccaceae bacterium]